MIISDKHKFMYVAVPKTGTTSIHDHFSKLNDETMLISKRTRISANRNPGFIYRHIKLIEFGNEIGKYKNYFKFAFVRNPWDLAVSWYKYLQRGEIKNSPRSSRGMSFSEFLYDRKDRWDELVTRGPQSGWIVDMNGNKLVDFIGRFEKLQQDLNYICDKIGITQQQLRHKNKSKHKHYTEYYDDETKQIVAQLYARDIELFGYIF